MQHHFCKPVQAPPQVVHLDSHRRNFLGFTTLQAHVHSSLMAGNITAQQLGYGYCSSNRNWPGQPSCCCMHHCKSFYAPKSFYTPNVYFLLEVYINCVHWST
eukprot:scaffold54227_cov24-Tisochrysis_lutea.AAC.4